ncbi:hypothetical protein [Arenibacter palladensis]|nr:hypothetical protein [Arenibacter palladensis]MDO6604458.1 hypothetical protein [Arenibacter palladensis]
MKFNKFIPILFSIEPIILIANGEEKEWRNELFLESLFTGRDTTFS